MNIDDAKEVVIEAITSALEGKAEVAEDMQLIGGESLWDSMKLVEVCLALEDLADENGFEFDWTSEAAMSKSVRGSRFFGSGPRAFRSTNPPATIRFHTHSSASVQSTGISGTFPIRSHLSYTLAMHYTTPNARERASS